MLHTILICDFSVMDDGIPICPAKWLLHILTLSSLHSRTPEICCLVIDNGIQEKAVLNVFTFFSQEKNCRF